MDVLQESIIVQDPINIRQKMKNINIIPQIPSQLKKAELNAAIQELSELLVQHYQYVIEYPEDMFMNEEQEEQRKKIVIELKTHIGSLAYFNNTLQLLRGYLIQILHNMLIQLDIVVDDFEKFYNEIRMIGYFVYYFQESLPLKKSQRDSWRIEITGKVGLIYAAPRLHHLQRAFLETINSIRCEGSFHEQDGNKLNLLEECIIFMHYIDNNSRGNTFTKKQFKPLPRLSKDEKKKQNQTEKPKRTYEIVWEYQNNRESGKIYEDHFEKPYLALIQPFYKSLIKVKYQQLDYKCFLQWFQSRIDFEQTMSNAVLRYSENNFIEHKNKTLLVDLCDFLLEQTEQGPKIMILKNQFEQLEQLIHIVMYERQNIVKLAIQFSEVILMKADEAFKNIKVEKIDLDFSKTIYTRLNCVLKESQLICDRFSGLEVDCQEQIRTEFQTAKNKAFQQIVKERPFITNAMHILIDYSIRQREDIYEISKEVGYLLSVHEDKEQFFKKYKELLCFRMLDNSAKFYDHDRRMFDALQTQSISEHTIDVKKILADGEISHKVTDEINKSKIFIDQISDQISRVVVLIIGEYLISKQNGVWIIPSKGYEELFERRKNQDFIVEEDQEIHEKIKGYIKIQNQQIEPIPQIVMLPLPIIQEIQPHQRRQRQRREHNPLGRPDRQQRLLNRNARRELTISTQQKTRRKQIIQQEFQLQEMQQEEASQIPQMIEELPSQSINEMKIQLSPKVPIVITKIFNLVNHLLQQLKEHRFVSYPLLSLGYGEVQFRVGGQDYFLWMSTPQVVLALMIDTSPMKQISIKDLEEITNLDVKPDIQALIDKQIILFDNHTQFISVNTRFICQQKNIKVGPNPDKSVSSEELKRLNQMDEMKRQQTYAMAHIVQLIKINKSMLISDLVGGAYIRICKNFLITREWVHLIVQQLMREEIYLIQDPQDALKVIYLV